LKTLQRPYLAAAALVLAASSASCGWFDSNPVAADGDVGTDTADGDGDGAADSEDLPSEELPAGCEGDGDCDDGNPCNGDERCNTTTRLCEDGTPPEVGFVCDTDPRRICLGAACVASLCGDGYIDLGAGESCEPPNAGSCGPDCRLPCLIDDDCPDDLDPCNGEEYCDTASLLCASRDPLPAGSACGESPRKICVSGRCQESTCGDGVIDDGREPPEECEDGNVIDGDGCDGDCRFSCHDDTECGIEGCSTGTCDRSAHVCSVTPLPPGTPCRPSAGDCDEGEACDGESPGCPADALAPASTTCRPASGPCDIEERCTGSSAACPADAFLPPGASCSDADPCTYPDLCDDGGTCLSSDTGELHDVLKISSGDNHTCALMTTGAVMCWGGNESGQLGIGSTTGSMVPVDVTSLSTGVLQVCAGGTRLFAAGSPFACAVLAGGAVKCWGANANGQLGDGSTIDRLAPVDVTGISSGAATVATGAFHACALMAGGGVKCWGLNSSGQLGDGTSTNRRTPVDVTGLGSAAVAVSAGGYHTCAVLDTGEVQCWGMNLFGELGDGTSASSSRPVTAFGITSGAVAVSAGGFHTCALLGTGAARCWGLNGNGQVGDGSTEMRNAAVQVLGLTSGVAQVSTGAFHSCARTVSGGLLCWGDGSGGKLGNGSTSQSTSPVDVTGLSSGAAFLSTGISYAHTCAALDTGAARCWGANEAGQLGDGSSTDRSVPVAVVCD
jgi:cysteine-rich repeat protein